MGLPCVVSGAAWRGTVIPAGDGILVTDEAAEFAERVVQLLRNATLRVDMATKARAAVEANYRWADQMAALDRVIANVTTPPPKPASVWPVLS